MVKPMPQSIATPSNCPQLAPAGNAARRSLIASQVRPNTPTVLPASKPTAIPSGTGWVKLSNVMPANETPALANANSGRMA
ncbi:hypothetical protein D3C79_843620 [compost metagenome]